MATISRARIDDEPRSGGKIVRNKRIAAARTPYDRPRLRSQVLESPSWLAVATRMVATGAGKFLSSVFGPDSSSSSTSSDGDSDDEVDDDNDLDDISIQGADRLHTKNGMSSKMIQYFRKEPQSIELKNETKHLIEQLLKQETFSRDECDRLIRIIKSRVVDCPIRKDGQDGSLSEIPNRTVGNDARMTDLCSTAVMAAKRWLEEKKSGSSSKPILDHGTCSLNSFMLQQGTEAEAGSPVDMAKSYMRARPLWSSPSMNHIEFRTPSPTRIQPYKEEAKYSISGNSLSSSKLKMDPLTTGSWNILEEIRRVRAKATEDLLGTLPSTKIDSPAFVLEHKTSLNSLVTGKAEAGMGDKLHDSNSFTGTKSIDESLNLAIEVTTCHGIPVSDMTRDGLRNQALPSTPIIYFPEQNQDLEASQSNEGKQGLRDGSEDILSYGQKLKSSNDMKAGLQSDVGDVDALKDMNGSNLLLNCTSGGTIQDSRTNERNSSTSKEATGLRDASTANGFPSLESSLSAGLGTDPNPGPSKKELLDPVSSSYIKITTRAPGEETCELLSEASIEVPIINETEDVASGSQNSSSMQYEELSQKLPQTNSNCTLAGKTSMVEKHQVKRLTRYNRKSRGRGK
ncbi:hypothetical protein L1049_013781 [Liquidambar formosana]|uniref:Protein KAKU4 n=1 Tax=Liquidambar formosana TaxID=63359 RepID=A0AAP0RQQ8_LIQFO